MSTTEGLRRSLRFLGAGGYDPDNSMQAHTARLMRLSERWLKEHPEETVERMLLAHLALVAVAAEEIAHQRGMDWNLVTIAEILGPSLPGLAAMPRPPRDTLELKEMTKELRQ